MKRTKWLVILLALTLCLCFLPATAHAADWQLKVTNSAYSDGYLSLELATPPERSVTLIAATYDADGRLTEAVDYGLPCGAALVYFEIGESRSYRIFALEPETWQRCATASRWSLATISSLIRRPISRCRC